MAILAPMIIKQQVVSGKVETTTGTEIATAAADGTVVFFADEGCITLDDAFIERPGQGTSSMHEGTPGALVGSFKASSELRASGTGSTAANWEKYLLAAGFAATVGGSSITYNPVTGASNMTSLTLAHDIDGTKFGIRGTTLDFVMRGQSGEPVRIDWTGKGAWLDPTNRTLIAPTYVDTPIPPRFVSSTITIGGSAYIISGFEFGMGNVIAVRRDGGSANGVHSTAISDRKPYLQLEVEMATTKNWFTDFSTGATAAASIAIGGSAGNIWTLAMPKAQLMMPPEKISDNGVLRARLKFQGVRSTMVGDDELTLTQS
jgi:hypothetical protein